MELDIETTPTALRSAFVAPTLGGSVAGVCPQTGRTAMGHRPWSPLIT